jgi:hypothetical protein
LPDFPWYNKKTEENMPNDHKIGIPNGHKIYQHRPLQDPRKFTQSGDFGLKINHLATLAMTMACD